MKAVKQMLKEGRNDLIPPLDGQETKSQPAVALLSNGSYSVMITSACAGYSTWHDLDVTRWREDATRDCWGQFYYVRDFSDQSIWSIGIQPLPQAPDECAFEFHPDRAEFRRMDGDVETRCAVCVVPDADAEVRVVTLVNHGCRHREFELTSYAEVCLNNRRADQAHPAFAKLFMETEFDPRYGALLARRRPRGVDEHPVWAIHALMADVSATEIEYETDRVKFLGRGRTPANPAALDTGFRLSLTTGPVLDPIFSLRQRVHVQAGMATRLVFITGAAETYEAAIGIARRFRELEAIDQAFAGARVHCQSELRELELKPDEIALFNRLAAAVISTSSGFRDLDAVAANRLGQSGLWPYSISGDLPIVLVRVVGVDDETVVRQLIQWRVYTRRRGLKLDLVIMDERAGEPADQLLKELQTGVAREMVGKPGGVFFLTADKMPTDDAVLLAAAARAVLGGDRGSLAEQFDHYVVTQPARAPLLTHAAVAPKPVAPPALPPAEALCFWNGFGGFTHDGREYVIFIDGTSQKGPTLPPAPWTNVLANPRFGCLVTEAGLGYSWAGNSQMNRLTPWSNDPTSDSPGEVIYLRDEETGDFWTPTPLPVGPTATVTVRHGQGYTRYTHDDRNLHQDLQVFVPTDDPLKLVRLTVRNDGDRPRRLSATYYAEWVLGTVRENAPLQVVCDRDPESGAILARNAWAGDFAEKIAFLASGTPAQSVTADRMEFLGEHGSVSMPAALGRVRLSGRVGPALDPCAAITTEMTLAPGETREAVFALGQADDLDDVHRLIREYTQSHQADAALSQVQQQWDLYLNALQVSTPDPGMDLMLNRWLVYQVLGCRVWARSAFYQSGGAYGFRDQLQDVMALVYSAPAEARAQILRSASRQFEEGDVQHWWHPPSGIGVRTRITDDLYFLPFVVHHYVVTTGDTELLNEVVPFIASPVLTEEQEEDFNLPALSEQTGTVYEHCIRALRHGYRLGSHGLPLMGTGDWNDGMNKVGVHGKGESIWNGWFFVTVLNAFADLAERRSQADDADWCRERAEQLRVALEANAWDGAWYRRAYFDDGSPLGSAQNDECQIDAIPQAWAVISGAADSARAQSGMAEVQKRLVRIDDKVIQLFDPPFDKGTLQPGYIKGYVPGIRENGGQYTHAATWVALATALQGRGDRAMELWNLINPVYHADTADDVHRYKVEPYVVCADVYGAPPHTGRGGWTWYTGSASWLYRVAVETILGFQLRGETLHFNPCIPPSWPRFELKYRHRSTTYRILVDNSAGMGRHVRMIELDGQRLANDFVTLKDDSKIHDVHVRLG
jgi:cellobiose phosphorylase